MFGGSGGHRLSGLPVALHIVALFLLVVLGVAVAALARTAARDWIQRRFGRSDYAYAAGAAAIIAVLVVAILIAVDILRS
jgi:hypothetical protein